MLRLAHTNAWAVSGGKRQFTALRKPRILLVNPLSYEWHPVAVQNSIHQRFAAATGRAGVEPVPAKPAFAPKQSEARPCTTLTARLKLSLPVSLSEMLMSSEPAPASPAKRVGGVTAGRRRPASTVHFAENFPRRQFRLRARSFLGCPAKLADQADSPARVLLALWPHGLVARRTLALVRVVFA